jgi:hypothetical protein
LSIIEACSGCRGVAGCEGWTKLGVCEAIRCAVDDGGGIFDLGCTGVGCEDEDEDAAEAETALGEVDIIVVVVSLSFSTKVDGACARGCSLATVVTSRVSNFQGTMSDSCG